MPTKKLTPAQRAERAKFRADHAKLYKAGLVKKSARDQKQTRHAKETHRKFAAFLAGKAQVVTVPRKQAKEYRDKFAGSGTKVVVPKTRKGERIRYSTKQKEIVSTATEGGVRVSRRYRTFSIEELRKLEGPRTTFSVIIPRGTGNEVFRERTVDELANIFARGSWRNMAEQWIKYVNVEKSEKARARIDGEAGE